MFVSAMISYKDWMVTSKRHLFGTVISILVAVIYKNSSADEIGLANMNLFTYLGLIVISVLVG